jgi:hypothetical protein
MFGWIGNRIDVPEVCFDRGARIYLAARNLEVREKPLHNARRGIALTEGLVARLEGAEISGATIPTRFDS